MVIFEIDEVNGERFYRGYIWTNLEGDVNRVRIVSKEAKGMISSIVILNKGREKEVLEIEDLPIDKFIEGVITPTMKLLGDPIEVDSPSKINITWKDADTSNYIR